MLAPLRKRALVAQRVKTALTGVLMCACGSALAGASVFGDVLNGNDYRDSGPIVASGSVGGGGYELRSSADLSTGTLRAAASALRSGPVGTRNSAEARIEEQFTFLGGIGQTAYLDFTFHGSMSQNADGRTLGGLGVSVTNSRTSRGDSESIQLRAGFCNLVAPPTICFDGDSIDYVGTLAFTIESGAYSFVSRIVAFAGPGFASDFANTSKFYFRLPDGVSISSQSGAFLVNADPIIMSPVPEPETWALLAGGLGMLGWQRRRACRSSAST
jgi:hypothetical protein